MGRYRQSGQTLSKQSGSSQGWFQRVIKPGAIFLVLTAVLGARLPESLAEITDGNTNLLIAAVYGMVGVLLSTTRLHFLVSSLILFGGVVFNLPREFAGALHQSLEGMLLLPLIVVSLWMAMNLSRLLSFVALTLGLGLLMPSDLPPPLHMEPNYLLASLMALLVTPLIHILTTKRDRGM